MAAKTAAREANELIAALTQIRDLSDSDREVVDGAAEMLVALHEEVERLSEQVRWLAGKPYRPSRDKVPPGQLAFELIEMLTALHAQGDADHEITEAKPPAKKRKKRKRRARELRREIIENRIDETDRCCAMCEKTKVEIGYEKQERFLFKPAELYIEEERFYKYACPDGCGKVDQAEPSLPPKPIPGSMASASLLAHLIVSKLLDGLPIERIAKRLRRHGADLATSTLNDWIGRVAQMFVSLHKLLHKQLLESSLVSLDDTPMPARSRGHPKGIQAGRFWIYLGDLDRVAYCEFTPDWKGVHPRRVLEGYGGDIQNDGYAGINPLFVGHGAPRRVGCNDHARRRFVHALEQRDSRAQPVVDLYKALYRVEREAKEAGADGTLALRRAKSVPLWDRLTETIAQLSPTVTPKSPLAKAIIYWERQQSRLRAFLDDGRLPISNAHVERQIRTVALFRKNSLFFGTLGSGERHAVLLSIVLNCVLSGVNPYEYLVDVITKIAADWPARRAAELLPRNWLKARQREDELHGDGAAA